MRQYTYHVTEDKVYCITKFAGKAIKGVAKCDPEDTFNLDTGKGLSKCRCNAKIATKKHKIACDKLEEARTRLIEATKYMHIALENFNDTYKKMCEVNLELEEFENKLINP